MKHIEEKEFPTCELSVKEVYGIDLKVYKQFWYNDDYTIDHYIVRLVSPIGKEYLITEYLKGNLTDRALYKETEYKRFVDAERMAIEDIKRDNDGSISERS